MVFWCEHTHIHTNTQNTCTHNSKYILKMFKTRVKCISFKTFYFKAAICLLRIQDKINTYVLFRFYWNILGKIHKETLCQVMVCRRDDGFNHSPAPALQLLTVHHTHLQRKQAQGYITNGKQKGPQLTTGQSGRELDLSSGSTVDQERGSG